MQLFYFSLGGCRTAQLLFLFFITAALIEFGERTKAKSQYSYLVRTGVASTTWISDSKNLAHKVNLLDRQDPDVEFVTQALSLINSLISSPDDVEDRVKTRKKFAKLKLNKKLDALRWVNVLRNYPQIDISSCTE